MFREINLQKAIENVDLTGLIFVLRDCIDCVFPYYCGNYGIFVLAHFCDKTFVKATSFLLQR